MKKLLPLVILHIFLLCPFLLGNPSNYEDSYQLIENFDFSKRVVPVIPPKDQVINVIIDSDAKCEVDDQYAIALALLSPERFNILGIVGAQYLSAGPESIQNSKDEIDTLLKLTQLSEKIPSFKGSDPMRYAFEPSGSEGVDFIIEKAMETTPDNPIWVVGLGAATDMASAYLIEPKIVDRVVVFWHLRTAWPDRCVNFNVFGDIHAAKLLFHSPLSFVLFDTGENLTSPMKETEENVKPYGGIGNYLYNLRLQKFHARKGPFPSNWYSLDSKGFFDLGDIAAILDPDIAQFEIVDCPEISLYMDYRFTGTKGKILRCSTVDRDQSFNLLYEKLKTNYSKN